MPNVMLRNEQGLTFHDVSTAGGFGHLQKGHGVAFDDIDNDGDQDIYHQLGGFYEGDGFANALFLNPGNDHRFLYVKLVGTMSPRTGVGAKIKVIVDTPGGPRAVHRAVGSVSSFGGSPLRQEIGLGNATRIVRLEVTWPRNATTQVYEDVPLDTLVRAIEGTPVLEVVPMRSIDLER